MKSLFAEREYFKGKEAFEEHQSYDSLFGLKTSTKSDAFIRGYEDAKEAAENYEKDKLAGVYD